jgi:hypothetical protein
MGAKSKLFKRRWVTGLLQSALLARRLGYALKEVAAYFGRDSATVATLLGRMEERMTQDRELWGKIERLNKKIES